VKISCPTCSAKYSIADDKVQNRLAKIRCRKCGTSIVIDGNVSPANVYAADGGTAGAEQPAAAAQVSASGTVYSVDLGENDQRQLSVSDIVQAYNAGMITAETYVWADGFADWTALAQVEEIVAALHAAAQQDSPTAPDETSAASASTAPEENPWDQQASAPSGGGADLFGNVASAGSFDDQPAAPVVRPEPSPFGGGEATGARNESSVLFSLSALTSSASTSRPSVPAPAASAGVMSEDSGLIDLKALTAAAEATAHAPAAVAPIQTPLAASPLGMAPLGAPAAYAGGFGGGIGASIPPHAAKGNNNALIIGGFLFAAIVAAAAIMTLGGGEEEQPVAPPAPVAAPLPAPAPEPAPIPTAQSEGLPTSDAKPPSTGTEDDESAPKKPSGTQKKPTGSKPATSASSSSSSSPSPSPSPAPAPAPSVGKCGCKKDDLMCLMNCAQ
jgi:predicted Zn finger-like uncharacterized protein